MKTKLFLDPSQLKEFKVSFTPPNDANAVEDTRFKLEANRDRKRGRIEKVQTSVFVNRKGKKELVTLFTKRMGM